MVGWWDGRMVGRSGGRMVGRSDDRMVTRADGRTVGRSDGRANKPSMNLNCGVQRSNNFQTWLFDWEFYIWKIVFPKLVFFQNRFFHRVFSIDKNKMEKNSNSNRPNESNRNIDPGNRPTEKSSAKIAWPQSAADSHEKYYKIQSSNANLLCFYSIFFINPITLISDRRRRFFYTLQKAIVFFIKMRDAPSYGGDCALPNHEIREGLFLFSSRAQKHTDLTWIVNVCFLRVLQSCSTGS